MFQFCLVQDDDCHWYVIPVSRLQEWDIFIDLNPDEVEFPDYATPVGGSPSRVVFPSFEVR